MSSLAVSAPGGAFRDYFWAAGVMPAGVAKLSYTFPDGVTEQAVVQGNFWIVRHLASKPTPPGQSQLDQPRIQARLLRADGSTVRTFKLAWAEETCAQVNHGC